MAFGRGHEERELRFERVVLGFRVPPDGMAEGRRAVGKTLSARSCRGQVLVAFKIPVVPSALNARKTDRFPKKINDL